MKKQKKRGAINQIGSRVIIITRELKGSEFLLSAIKKRKGHRKKAMKTSFDLPAKNKSSDR